MRTLTPRYPPHIKPVRPGFYMTDAMKKYRMNCFQYWTGTYWGIWSVKAVMDGSTKMSMYQEVSWRGLNRKVK